MLNYVKDFKNNKITTVDKGKDPNRAIKGVGFIEVANDAEFNDLVYEARSENTLTKEVMEDILYYAMVNSAGQNGDTFTFNPFGKVVLTNHDGAEDSTNHAILGDVIGFANAQVQSASTNPKQGNVDSIDTYFDFQNNRVEFVFNFPPGKAVGQFRTVWWTNGREVEDDTFNSPDGHAYTPFPVETWDADGIPTGTYACNPLGDIFVITANQILKYKLLQTGLKKKLQLLETRVNPQEKQPFCMTFNPTTQEFWGFYLISSVRYFYVFDRDMNYIRHFTSGNRPSATDSTGFRNFMTSHGKWLYTFDLQASRIYVHDYNGVYKSQITTLLIGLDNLKGVYSDQKYIYVFYTDKVNRFFCETLQVDDETGQLVSISKTLTNQKIPAFVNSGAYLWDTMRNGYIIHSLGYFLKSFNYATVQTKLPEAIIKEESQYMRLRYAFNFQ